MSDTRLPEEHAKLATALFSRDPALAEDAMFALESLPDAQTVDVVVAVLEGPERFGATNFAQGVLRAAALAERALSDAHADVGQIDRLLVAAERLFVSHFAGYESDPEGAVYMFWDRWCFPWYLRGGLRQRVGLLVEVLDRILHIPKPLCQKAAIHGLNHVRDPRKLPVLESFLAGCSDVELVEMARSAMVGALQ